MKKNPEENKVKKIKNYQKKGIIDLKKEVIPKLIKFSQDRKISFKNTFLTLRKRVISCCENENKIFLYDYLQGTATRSGKIKICCEESLEKELKRIGNLIQKPLKTNEQIYLSCYNRIRGSVGHVIFEAFLGKNEWKYIRESKNIKEGSLLEHVKQNVSPCDPKLWDKAIDIFIAEKSQKNIERIIKLYSPMYRGNTLIIKRMAEEIISYLPNIPSKWEKEEIRIVDTHIGMCDLVVGSKLVEFKFSENKIGIKRENFEQLYRYYRSACELNFSEKEKLKTFVVFSPITREIHEMTIKEADEKWQLSNFYNENFKEWQLNNLINYNRLERSILERKVRHFIWNKKKKIKKKILLKGK